MSEDINNLVCAPYNAGDVIPGSVIGVCAECGADVEVAPTGQAMLARGTVNRIVCVPCGLALIAQEDDPKVRPPTAEQILELDSWRRRN